MALEQIALTQNPGLARLKHSYGAALARSEYADKLPDPTVMTNVFGNPLETAAGSQRANFTVSQAIPWLGRLNAREQSQVLEALAVHAEFRAARLRVVADVRSAWFRLFVIARQIDTTEANQELLESLIEVANARVATGAATQGDVLLGTLELSRLEEQLLTYRQQEISTKALLNRLLGRSAVVPVDSPDELNPSLPEWTHPMLVDLALAHQPEIDAARLRTQASQWGIEVARLSRRPDFML
ncbi:MAG: TolC family protein, partial [Planctomycetaceae bacterium]|nr:TolC family protein [Planctomycetaceae bacterium]